MSEDIKPTLTEKLERFLHLYRVWKQGVIDDVEFEEYESLEQQFKEILDQYPKLKEQLYATQERMIKAKDDAWNTWKVEYEKLKAENEELKQLAEDRLFVMGKTKAKLKQENDQLKQVIEEGIGMLNSVENDFNIEQVSNLRDKLQLLKGDSTS